MHTETREAVVELVALVKDLGRATWTLWRKRAAYAKAKGATPDQVDVPFAFIRTEWVAQREARDALFAHLYTEGDRRNLRDLAEVIAIASAPVDDAALAAEIEATLRGDISDRVLSYQAERETRREQRRAARRRPPVAPPQPVAAPKPAAKPRAKCAGCGKRRQPVGDGLCRECFDARDLF